MATQPPDTLTTLMFAAVGGEEAWLLQRAACRGGKVMFAASVGVLEAWPLGWQIPLVLPGSVSILAGLLRLQPGWMGAPPGAVQVHY